MKLSTFTFHNLECLQQFKPLYKIYTYKNETCIGQMLQPQAWLVESSTHKVLIDCVATPSLHVAHLKY